MVGFFMLRAIANVDWRDYETGIPAFAALILIPFTYSISQGISWSLIAFILLKVFNGKIRETTLMQWIVVAFAIAALYMA